MGNKQIARRLNGSSAESKHPSGANGANGANGGNGLNGGQEANGAAPKNGHAKRVLPVIQNGSPVLEQRRLHSASSETDLRYWLASLVRLSDNIVLKAVAAYNRIFELKSEDQADIYLAMARDYARDGKVDEVLEALHKAVVRRPDDGKIRMHVGLFRLKAKAPAAAIQSFQQAKALGYSSYRLHMSLAEALVQQNEHELALGEYQQALQLSPNTADTLHKMGIVLDRLSRFQEAAEAFRQAVELVPEEVLYHQSLGFALESAGRRADAVKCFKRALELEQQHREFDAE